MKHISGKHADAKVFTDVIEETAMNQIQSLLDSPIAIGSKIRFMPDIHAGAGCTIGTTMTITDKIVPNFVGVDIGCGVLVQELGNIDIDLQKLDKIIHKYVPAGFSVNAKRHRFSSLIDLNLKCHDNLTNIERHYLAIGSLGGGNHFIEINQDDSGNKYLVIHSGSRNIGKQVADYYQKQAYQQIPNREDVDKQTAYCTGQLMEDYLHDVKIIQKYAALNRLAIADIIQCGMRLDILGEFETIHNYIDDFNILRKGAVSSKNGETLIIPINMRDGSLICIGKGNPDWNYSAPHGAGRIMSRTQAKNSLSLSDFETSMNGIYTTCISKETLDESPFVYKSINDILYNINETVYVKKIIKPIYNFKAGKE